MANVNRRTRQAVKVMNETLDLYNFETAEECLKLSFTPEEGEDEKMPITSPKMSPTKRFYGEKTMKSGLNKPNMKYLVKSPSYEFFSNKLGKSRKSDSGVFMSPSPVLRDVSNSKRNYSPTRSTEKPLPSKSRNIHPDVRDIQGHDRKKSDSIFKEQQLNLHIKKETTNSNCIVQNNTLLKSILKKTEKSGKVQVRNTRSRLKVDVSDQALTNNTLTNVNSVENSSSKKLKTKTVNPNIEVETKSSRCKSVTKENSDVKSAEKNTVKKTALASKNRSSQLKTERCPKTAVNRRTSSAKLMRNQARCLRSGRPTTMTNGSTRSSIHSLRTTHSRGVHSRGVLYSRIKQKANTKFSIKALVEKSKQVEVKKIISIGPTSTPNVMMRPKRSMLADESVDIFSPPRVSPVQKFTSPGGRVHGAVFTSPASPDGLGSPTLKRKTRQSIKQELGSPALKTTENKSFSDTVPVAQSIKGLPKLVLERLPSSVTKSYSKKQEENIAKSPSNLKQQHNRKINNRLCKDKLQSDTTAQKQTNKQISKENLKPSVTKKFNSNIDVQNSVCNKRKLEDKKAHANGSSSKVSKTKETEVRLSMNLFEDFSPVKEKLVKKKSPVSGKKTCPVEITGSDTDAAASPTAIDVNSSLLDISKTYKDSFSFKSSGDVKKKKGRYSTSKLDFWAQKKNEEFEDLESYELSMD